MIIQQIIEIIKNGQQKFKPKDFDFHYEKVSYKFSLLLIATSIISCFSILNESIFAIPIILLFSGTFLFCGFLFFEANEIYIDKNKKMFYLSRITIDIKKFKIKEEFFEQPLSELHSVKFERLNNSKRVVVVFKTTIIPLSRVYSNLEEQDKKLNTLVEWLKKNNIHIN